MRIKSCTKIYEYQLYFNELYGDINSSRNWEEIYSYLSRTTGYLTRSLIKNKYDESSFIRPLSWLFALANKIDLNLQDSFYKKYPNICYYCLERVCCCFRTGKMPVKNIPAYKLIEERNNQFYVISNNSAPKNFSNAVSNISGIYPNNEIIWHFSGPWMNCSKLFEEVAELHEAICKFNIGEKSKENVEEEIADVLAWIISAWISAFNEKSLDDAIISYYYNGCPVCRKDPCRCNLGDSRIQGLVDAEKFKELRNYFEELDRLSPNAIDDIQDLITSLKEVENTQNEAVANATISEAKSKINNPKFMEVLDSAEITSRKTKSIVDSIMGIIEMFSQ
ncbi:MazG nucleotide pyrophosphohydrolase domain-containing protein [Vibrio cholerae]|uniref:MazG nucleotide pyrophosphohydrolase domain-containing protein n=1 Tax=Vibrio cholerae TaxID=666 RepID=UPI0019648B45|nr:MazG nucleotide pyrophosphohydrolase domain-containing protein [Vibrio cholerae]EKF9279462.1 hypothetical protein [Vibrio cholerae]